MVDVSNKQKSVVIKVTASNGNTNITASSDTAQYWSNASRNYSEHAKISAHEAEQAKNEVLAQKDSVIADIENVRAEAVESVTAIATTGVASVDEKVSTGIANIEAKTTVGVELVEATQNNAVNALNTTKTNAVTEINNTKTTAVNAVNTSKTEALNAINQTGVNNLANKDLSNLSATGEARFASGLNNKITNCITEIPQNIKLELANGTLTLKAGSKVIVPNGFEADGTTPKFDYVLVENDTKYVATTASIAHHLYSTSEKNIKRRTTDRCYSGNAEPTSIKEDDMWYDTANNIIKRRVGSSWNSTLGLSLPFCIATDDGTSYTIDQVFNGFGYIGSTIWVDKGVKGLIPNGRDEDGSLNNIEWVNDKLKLRTFTFSATNGTLGFSPFQTNQIQCGQITYNETDNIQYSGSFSWLLTNIGTCTLTNGVVTNFQPKQTFRAIDYNDKSEIIGWGIPDYTAGVNVTSGSYTAPKNGALIGNLDKGTNSPNEAVLTIQYNGITIYTNRTGSYPGLKDKCYCPVVGGHTYTINVNSTYNTLTFYPFRGA